jgi:hypothetical protein
MGSCMSRDDTMSHLDDSVHVMLSHDKRAAAKRGQTDVGYKPREEHPMLTAAKKTEEEKTKPIVAEEKEESTPAPSPE